MVITPVDSLLRMGVAVVLGSAIGYEREHSGRPAGLRTHLLVALASATFMLVSTQFVYFQQYGKDDLISVDTSRIAASVVAGVGFLGAGAILRTGLGVQGLTTAASLWLVASVGLAAGGGMYQEACVATLVTLFSLMVLRRVEGKQWRLVQRRLVLVLASGGAGRRTVLEQLQSHGASAADVEYEHNLATNESTLELDLRLANEQQLEAILVHLEALPDVRRVKVQRLST
jgi:putative Mg2+ transporter-C (MgtC) family protein